MAGERSKRIGEIGESIAENFFNKIGWGLPQKGVYHPCYKPKVQTLVGSWVALVIQVVVTAPNVARK